MEGLVGVQRYGAVCVLTLTRPEKLNALSSALEEALDAALGGDEVAAARAVVIAGEGRAFSAGADVTEFRDRDPASIMAYYRETGDVYERVAGLPVPTVAAVHGYCLGGGLELALACDFRVAETSAALGFPEIGLGILPSSGGLTRVVRMVGAARAKELMLVRERFSASEALASEPRRVADARGVGHEAGCGGGPRVVSRGRPADRAPRVRHAGADARG